MILFLLNWLTKQTIHYGRLSMTSNGGIISYMSQNRKECRFEQKIAKFLLYTSFTALYTCNIWVALIAGFLFLFVYLFILVTHTCIT